MYIMCQMHVYRHGSCLGGPTYMYVKFIGKLSKLGMNDDRKFSTNETQSGIINLIKWTTELISCTRPSSSYIPWSARVK